MENEINKIESVSKDRLLVIPEESLTDFPIIAIREEDGGKLLALVDITDGGFVISSGAGISAKVEYTSSKGKIQN
tara:strand:- start:544 stop:768 length:225 start_codon:yes stop_codon:yes gene_type:complete